MFSATRALTLLCVIWTEAHTPRQVKMAVWPYFHGFAMVLNNWFGSSVANLSHAWPLINTEVSLIIVHCVVTYLKDVFAEVATAFDKKCTIAR